MASDENPPTQSSADEQSEQDSREQGVDIGPLADELEEHSYPTTTKELIDEYGDYEIDLENGRETVEEIFGRFEDHEFESEEDVRQMIYNLVGAEAVGRTNYSDRGGISTDSSSATDEEGDGADGEEADSV
ncbi:hypothetical protein ACFQJC_06290 [Haloferax namakaokahaiae]|uniref:DUF2795 domain-containing protein n=1 Tax=Haloferax namakaokahaiae TaxID=1748331 RepID=A0ABD5ZCW0_9EURY